MKKNRYEKAAFISVVIGIGGIAGAVEHGNGMIISFLMLATGAGVLYGMYRKEREEKNSDYEKESSSIVTGSSIGAAVDKHAGAGSRGQAEDRTGRRGGRIPDSDNRILSWEDYSHRA